MHIQYVIDFTLYNLCSALDCLDQNPDICVWGNGRECTLCHYCTYKVPCIPTH